MESLDLDASGKSELTVSRSSSLIANLSGNDDDDADTRDLFIIVDDPEKHSGTMDSYVTFRITVKVKLDSTRYSLVEKSLLLVDRFSPVDQNWYLANSVDPDEMAHNEPSHQDLHCLLFWVWYYIKTPILEQWLSPNSKMEWSHLETQGWTG